MVPPIFKDKSQQELFNRQGFVVVKFLEADEVTKLNRVFDEMHPHISDQHGFVSGSYSGNFEYKKKASDAIISVFSKHFERIFENYQTFGAAFLYKTPTQGSELGVHQDWTIVDEDKYVAINCWVPLTDINETNGGLQMLPGSQYDKHYSLRGPTLPFFFAGSESETINRTIPMYVKAGEAILLNQSLIHYSPPNRSGKIRKAITAGVKTKGAPMVFPYKTEDGFIEKYEMPENFLISFENFATSIFERPASGKLVERYAYADTQMKKDELKKLLTKLKEDAGYKPASSFWDFSFLKKRGKAKA